MNHPPRIKAGPAPARTRPRGIVGLRPELVPIRRDHLAEGAGAQGAVGRHADRLLEELDRAVDGEEMGPAGMIAAETELAQEQTARVVDPAGRVAVLGCPEWIDLVGGAG